MAGSGELQKMRDYFESGETKPFAFRREQLNLLLSATEKYEAEIFAALYTDLHKSPEECWITENGFFLSELKHTLKHLKSWMSPQRVRTNLLNFPSKSSVLHEPLGVVLIMAPWNYPLQLLFTPLISALAAGNCVVLKPSEQAPATAAVMRKIIESSFSKEYVMFCEGDGAEVVPALMQDFVFDHVFYTGSTATGKIVYELAARNLVPVTLELGGKTPCIVESDADIRIAAKRIAFPKFSNAGQMCVAPDYVLVHESVKEKLTEELQKCISGFFGSDARRSPFYGRIINDKQFMRLEKLLKDGALLHGGASDRKDLYIEPTLLSLDDNHAAVMQEEIFGPILPLISFTDTTEALAVIRRNKNPLAMYIFTSSKEKEAFWLSKVPAGGGCINNASLHLTNPNLPFGGRGASGTGNYHGRFGFDTFSHRRGLMKTPVWPDLAVKYPPYTGKLNFFKKLIG